jgi:hypothetical protein
VAEVVIDGGDVAARERFDADPGQVALSVRDLLRAAADQRQRGIGGKEPAKVGYEAVAVLEAERAGYVPGRERPPLAQVDDPLPGGDPPADLTGIGWRGRGQVNGGRPSGVGRPHPRVVGRVVVQRGQQARHVGIRVEGEGRVTALLVGNRRTVSRGHRRGQAWR